MKSTNRLMRKRIFLTDWLHTLTEAQINITLKINNAWIEARIWFDFRLYWISFKKGFKEYWTSRSHFSYVLMPLFKKWQLVWKNRKLPKRFRKCPGSGFDKKRKQMAINVRFRLDFPVLPLLFPLFCSGFME